MTPKRKREPPMPPPGLTPVGQNAWLQVWRRVLVDPSAEVKPWSGGTAVKITASLKSVGLWASTWADYDDGTRIFPGLEKLANAAGVTPKTAGVALAGICRLGFLWQYIDGSMNGRPVNGQSAVASEYRLTVPGDYLTGRIPFLTAEYRIPGENADHPNSDQVNSLHLISDQGNSDPGSPELSSQITRTQFAPPNQDLVTHPDTTGVSVVTTSVEGEWPGPRTTETENSEASASSVAPLRCEYGDCPVPQKPVPIGNRYHTGCDLAMRRALADAPPAVKAFLHEFGTTQPRDGGEAA
jgi:hypothetical protein